MHYVPAQFSLFFSSFKSWDLETIDTSPALSLNTEMELEKIAFYLRQDPEKFDEEVKSLVTAWFLSLGSIF